MGDKWTRMQLIADAADGMTTKQAVAYLKYGAEMVKMLGEHCHRCVETSMATGVELDCRCCSAHTLLTKLEASHGKQAHDR